MSDWAGSLGDQRKTAECIGWVLAAGLVLCVHAAGGYWLVAASERAPEPGVPEELIIEIALEAAAPPEPDPEPDAIPDIPMVAAPDLPFSETEPPDRPDETPPEPVQEMIEPDPLAEMQPDDLPIAEAPPEPLPEPELPMIETAEVSLAPQESRRPPPRPERPQTTRAAPAPRTSAPPRVEAPKVAEAAAAPAARAGVSAERAEQNWQREVNNRVARHVGRWTNRTRSRATIYVVISIDGAGRVLGVSVQGSTGDASADASLSGHAGRLSGLPRTPDGRNRNLRVPVTLR